MKTKTESHTPGPWISHKAPCTKGGCGFVIQQEAHRGIMIACLFPGTSTDRIEPIAEANARLIAATPELLSASENSAEFIGQTLEFLYEQFPEEELQDDTPDELLEAFDSAGYGNSKGELYRIVAQLKRTKQANEQAIAKATGGDQ